ncbi:MAG: hypothetical protein MJZ05_12090 [Fibrobacter sp.]|nr:hypothetical protein [Fibrobacter sp.]
MPIPFIVGAVGAIAAAAGVGAGVKGAVKMKDANDTIKSAQSRNERNVAKYNNAEKNMKESMDGLGKLELEVMKSFKDFADLYAQIKNRPKFKDIDIGNVKFSFNPEAMKDASVGASVLLGGLGGAAAGTAGGIAAGGAVTAAVAAFGTTSAGTLIGSLSGAAATNATLAFLGGGSLAAGGGGMALGSAVLGGATLGVGLLAAGIIFNITGSKLEEKADEIERKVDKAEKQINKLCAHFDKLSAVAGRYTRSIRCVYEKYTSYLYRIENIVEVQERSDWNEFTDDEKLAVQNLVRLATVLYNMCKVKLVNKSEKEGEPGSVNTSECETEMSHADSLLNEM